MSIHTSDLPFAPVCDPVPDAVLSSLLFYAPLALDFIYAECEVDMQLLAAQQGWRLLYASSTSFTRSARSTCSSSRPNKDGDGDVN